ncbi:MFS transporter [Actinocorallia longicatena]|uniref:MFS transporter n=1 Tax=Actinocorallia longicatena TaxID=111803 RepID=A0ABP6QLS4_9ACTN
MTQAATAVQASGKAKEAKPGGSPALTLLAVALGVIMVTLDGTVVAVANPSIGADLNASLADLQWVTNGYLLALAVFLITAGKLGDRFGHKTIFLTGIAGFAVTSLAIGLSSGITMLIAMRVLQGVFGAMLQPTALGLLRSAFPAEKLNMALGIWGAAIASSTAAGPIVGGLLVEHYSWQSVFYINVPVGIIAFAIGLKVLRNQRGEKSGFDVPGILLLSGAMFAVVYGIIKAPSWGWGDTRTIGLFAAAVALFAAFVWWENRAAEPLLPLGLFRSVSISVGTIMMLLVAFGMFGALFFLTFYMQSVHGLSPVDSGLRLLPMMLAMMVGSPIAGIMITKLGPRIPLIAGPLLAAGAFLGLTTLGLTGGFTDTLPWFVMLGLGLSPVFVGATDIIVGNAPVSMAGVASGLQNSAMQVGGALGTAVLGALMTARVGSSLSGHFTEVGLPAPGDAAVDQMKEIVAAGIAPVPPGTEPAVAELISKASHLAFIDGMHLAFYVAAVVSLVAAGLGLFVKAGRKVEGAVVHV